MQPPRVALYARVSTNDQHAENQVIELRTYCAARGSVIAAEYIDQGISGSATSRPQLDAMMHRTAPQIRRNRVLETGSYGPVAGPPS